MEPPDPARQLSRCKRPGTVDRDALAHVLRRRLEYCIGFQRTTEVPVDRTANVTL